MKKVIYCTLMVTAIAVACSKKTAPAGTTGATGSTTPGKDVAQPVTVTKTDAQNQADLEAKQKEEARQAEAMKASVAQKPSDEEAGQKLYNSKCTKCHGAKNISAYTVNQWESILKSMVPKAKLSADEETAVTNYIRAHAK